VHFLFLPCLINTSRAIKLIEVAFYHIPRCTLAERIPIYDSICNANRGQSFSSSNFSCFIRHCPCSSTSHGAYTHNSSSATLRGAHSGELFSPRTYILCARRRRHRWRLPESPAAVILASIQPRIYFVCSTSKYALARSLSCTLFSVARGE
jgi:hypothetical protein